MARAALSTQTEEALILLTREGRPAAYAELRSRYRAPLRSICSVHAPSGRVDEVVEDTLDAGHELLLESDLDPERLEKWMFATARAKSLQAPRRSRPMAEPEPERERGVLESALTGLRTTVEAINALPEINDQVRALRNLHPEVRRHVDNRIERPVGSQPQAGLRLRSTMQIALSLLLPLALVRLLTDGAGATTVAAVPVAKTMGFAPLSGSVLSPIAGAGLGPSLAGGLAVVAGSTTFAALMAFAPQSPSANVDTAPPPITRSADQLLLGSTGSFDAGPRPGLGNAERADRQRRPAKQAQRGRGSRDGGKVSRPDPTRTPKQGPEGPAALPELPGVPAVPVETPEVGKTVDVVTEAVEAATGTAKDKVDQAAGGAKDKLDQAAGLVDQVTDSAGVAVPDLP